MRFFSKEKIIMETKCRECGMEFSESERMIRHMIKAHTKKNPVVIVDTSQKFILRIFIGLRIGYFLTPS